MPHFTRQFQDHAPIVDAVFHVSEPRLKALTEAGVEIPKPVVGQALIDTGASCSCVDPLLTALPTSHNGRPRRGVHGTVGRLREQPRRGAVAAFSKELCNEDTERGLACAVRADDPKRPLPRIGRESSDEADRGVAYGWRDHVAVERVGIVNITREVDGPDVPTADGDARRD